MYEYSGYTQDDNDGVDGFAFDDCNNDDEVMIGLDDGVSGSLGQEVRSELGDGGSQRSERIGSGSKRYKGSPSSRNDIQSIMKGMPNRSEVQEHWTSKSSVVYNEASKKGSRSSKMDVEKAVQKQPLQIINRQLDVVRTEMNQPNQSLVTIQQNKPQQASNIAQAQFIVPKLPAKVSLELPKNTPVIAKIAPMAIQRPQMPSISSFNTFQFLEEPGKPTIINAIIKESQPKIMKEEKKSFVGDTGTRIPQIKPITFSFKPLSLGVVGKEVKRNQPTDAKSDLNDIKPPPKELNSIPNPSVRPPKVSIPEVKPFSFARPSMSIATSFNSPPIPTEKTTNPPQHSFSLKLHSTAMNQKSSSSNPSYSSNQELSSFRTFTHTSSDSDLLRKSYDSNRSRVLSLQEASLKTNYLVSQLRSLNKFLTVKFKQMDRELHEIERGHSNQSKPPEKDNSPKSQNLC